MSLSEPCRQCPWRRKAAPGFLGPHTPEEWIQIAHGDGLIACHMTVPDDAPNDEGDFDRDAGMAQCAGAAIYRANVAKLPRDPKHEARTADRGNCFGLPAEFLKHHEGGPGNG